MGRCLVGMEVGTKISITPIDMLVSLGFISIPVGEWVMGLFVEDLICGESEDVGKYVGVLLGIFVGDLLGFKEGYSLGMAVVGSDVGE